MKSDPDSVEDIKPYKPEPSPGRGTKYYKQAYRTEWESMPDFRGWLTEVPGEPTRAYCKYCEKTLHAHRLSLLKHTCTLKHTNAAQKSYLKQTTGLPGKPTIVAVHAASTSATVHIPVETTLVVVDPTDCSDKESSFVGPGSMHSEEDESMDDELPESSTLDERNVSELSDSHCAGEGGPAPKVPRLDMDESPLSTHVLDTARGNAVNGLHVSLYKLIEGRWTALHEGITTPDGRYTEFIKRKDFTAGRYKLHFDVDRYFELRNLEALYPFVEIVFDVKKPSEHYHVPLLISPYGYTTYRGS